MVSGNKAFLPGWAPVFSTASETATFGDETMANETTNSVAHLITSETVEVYWPEGCAPFTNHVEMVNANTHVTARDRLAHEAALLIAVKNEESLPEGWQHIAEGEDEDGKWCDVYVYEAAESLPIEATLKRLGPTFYGSNDTQCREIAKEWMEQFSESEAEDWMEAGFWCPITARQVADMCIEPGEVAGLCNDNITGFDDPVHSMCNGDLSVDALVE